MRKTIKGCDFQMLHLQIRASHSSQIGHITISADINNNATPISFKSYKSHRITISAMCAEVIAVSDVFHIAVALAQELFQCNGRRIPVQVLIESKCLCDVISKKITDT